MKFHSVFISSTFLDLAEERKTVIGSLTSSGYMVLGMENFNASSKGKAEYIKDKINVSNFFILITGKRYGSIEPKTQLSYTEFEYHYAKSIGIPILIFIQNNTESLIPVYREDYRLNLFIKNELDYQQYKIWDNKYDLVNSIKDSLNEEILSKIIEERINLEQNIHKTNIRKSNYEEMNSGLYFNKKDINYQNKNENIYSEYDKYNKIRTIN